MVDTSRQSCDFLQLVTKMVPILGASNAIFIKGSAVLNLPLGIENILSWVVRDCLGPLCLPGLSATYFWDSRVFLSSENPEAP